MYLQWLKLKGSETKEKIRHHLHIHVHVCHCARLKFLGAVELTSALN